MGDLPFHVGKAEIAAGMAESQLLVVEAEAIENGGLHVMDMNRAFKEYNKTKDAETKINDAKNAAKKEYDDRADAFRGRADR